MMLVKKYPSIINMTIKIDKASLGAANYDVLSPLGIRQSQLCGEHFGALGLHF